jgi:subtilase family protein
MHDLPPSSASPKLPSVPAQPYLEWALETRFSYLRAGDWIPLLIQFDADVARRSSGNDKLTALEAFATRRWLHDDPRTLDDKFIIPDLFHAPPKLLQKAADFDFCVALIRRDVDVVRQLITANAWKRTIVRLDLGPPVVFGKNAQPAPPARSSTSIRPATLRAAHHHDLLSCAKAAWDWIKEQWRGSTSPSTTPPPSGPPGSAGPPGSGSPPATPPFGSSGGTGGGSAASSIDRVVIAVIDQGIAFANCRFFAAGAPRIEYLWQQNAQTSVPAPAVVMPFTPGFELNKAAIQSAVATANTTGAGEDWVYRNFGGMNFRVDGYKPLARRTTHGTHVLDLATPINNPDKHPIIAVDMPEDAVGDPAGSTLSVQAAWALVYVLDRAARLRGPNETLPVVANLSYGPHEGPHDGTGLLETFMDQIWQLADGSDTPLEIVLAAGNFRQTRTHAAIDLMPNQAESLRWRLQPGSLSASQMEIWLPPGGGHQVTVTLQPPAPSATAPVVQVSTQAGSMTVSAPNALYSVSYVPAAGLIQADSIVLSIARTAPDPAGTWGAALAPSGVWLVTLSSTSAINGLNAWIKRSDTLSGRRAKGRQSYFDDPKYPRFDPTGRLYDFDPSLASYVRRMETLSGIATGQKTRVIAGYRNSDFFPALHSSHGSRLVGAARTGPDWIECTQESDVLRGLLAAGTRSGSAVSMNGTSVAAPQATRWIAQAWRGLPRNSRVPMRSGLKAPRVLRQRPIPAGDAAFIGNRLAQFTPRKPPRR